MCAYHSDEWMLASENEEFVLLMFSLASACASQPGLQDPALGWGCIALRHETKSPESLWIAQGQIA
jgi:hypothetical protein